MALVDRDGNGIWHIDLVHPVTSKRVRKSTKTTDKKQAEALHAKVQNEMFESQWSSKREESNLTLAEGFAKAYERQWAKSASATTVEFNYQRLKRYLSDKTLLRDIKLPLIDDVIAEMSGDYPGSTINRSMAVLNTILKLSRDVWEILDRVPKIPKQKEGVGRLRWLQDGEEQVITQFFRDKGDLDMAELIEVLLDTGCRLSEALKLGPKEVLVKEANIVLWNTKNQDWDVLPLTDRALRILSTRTKMQRPPFEGLTRHAAIHRFQIMKKHCDFQEDKELCLHTMRHTTASRLVMKGTDLKRVQQFMRHADINTTLRYAKLDTKERRRTLEVLN